jgi:2-deoxystreptamine N-acetyl-D-glucosaminyltransferase/2-deoxystreptamine glucosyltransferase
MIGGVESYVKGMSKELSAIGYDVHVYTPNSVLRRHLPNHDEQIDGVQVHRIDVPVDLSYRVKLWPGLRKALLENHHDIIHVYSHDSYSIFAAMAASAMKIPLLITTYGRFGTHSDYGPIEGTLLRAYDYFVTPSLFRRCDSVLVRYPEIIQWVMSLGLSESRISVEPSGIPQSFLRPASGSKFRDSISHHEQLIVYLGRVSPQKGVQYAVEAMSHVKKRFPRAKLAIVGPDYLGFSNHLMMMIRDLGLEENVVILEAASDEGMEAELLSACDVFVMPSSFEGFSQAVMKAMAQGKPVVVTNVGGLPYEVDYGTCGMLSEFGNAKALAENICEVLDSEELADRLGRNGLRRAELFTFDKLSLKLSKVYQSAMAN